MTTAPNSTRQDILNHADDTIARSYMLGLFMALEKVHSCNYIHWDVKPGNLLFDLKTRHLRLADFGLAQQADWTPGHYGTSGYRSPDNLLFKKVHASSDVWAAGIVLLAFLTQRERVWVSTDGKGRELYNVVALCGSMAIADLLDRDVTLCDPINQTEVHVAAASWEDITHPSASLGWNTEAHKALTSLAQECLRARPGDRWTAAQCVRALEKLSVL